MPRSVARHSAATSSTARTPSGPEDESTGTTSRYAPPRRARRPQRPLKEVPETAAGEGEVSWWRSEEAQAVTASLTATLRRGHPDNPHVLSN
jgi:hypothetical protein